MAEWWPLISEPEEYANEAEILSAVFGEFLGGSRNTLLDLGVGGGDYLSHLISDFDAVGVDLSPEMLTHSKQQNPTVEHHVGDLRTIHLGRSFDAVFIRDAIYYMTGEADLSAAFATARAHLNPGGVLVTCPDWFRLPAIDEFVSHATRRRGNASVTYIENVHDSDPSDSQVEVVMFLLIREDGRLRIEQDHHTVALFTRDTWLDLAFRADFNVETRLYVMANYGEHLALIMG